MYIKVTENDVLQKTDITLGSTNDTSAVIESGVTVGERIVTSPTEDMTDGANLSDFATTVEQKNTEQDSSILDNMGGNICQMVAVVCLQTVAVCLQAVAVIVAMVIVAALLQNKEDKTMEILKLEHLVKNIIKMNCQLPH